MNEWIPTEAGVYLLNGLPCSLARCPETSRLQPLNRAEADPRYGLSTAIVSPVMSTSGWSLLAPDWQGGAPTDRQLSAWPNWMIETFAGALLCGIWCWNEDGGLCGEHCMLEQKEVSRSAPIQPDLSSGPRYVPLSVTR